MKKPAITVLALACSLGLHAAAFAALLADWRRDRLDEPVLSVELVIVSAPVEAASVDEPAVAEPAALPGSAPAADAATVEPAAAPPEDAQAASVPESAPSPPEPAPSEPAPLAQPAQPAKPPPPPPPQPPTPQPTRPAKPQVAKPAPPPPRFEAPVTLDPGRIGGEQTQTARAPAGSDAPASFSVLHGPIPPYPPLARSRGQEGRVVLDVVIGVDGTPTSVVVARSSGAALLDDSAVTTVKTWRFRNDAGRALSLSVPIVFELRSTAGR
ncbi:MAG: TonB family protein [Reyranellaceae bacterium]